MTQVDFQTRVGTLQRQHKAMANGYTTELRSDGLIVVKPKRARGHGFPLRGLVLLAFGFCLFKGYMLAALGTASYDARVIKLSEGSLMEQAGAWVMKVDPITLSFAQMIVNLT